MFKYIHVVALLALCTLTACEAEKQIPLDTNLTPAGEYFLSNNGLANNGFGQNVRRQELKNNLRNNGRIIVHGYPGADDCGDAGMTIMWALLLGLVPAPCNIAISICYADEKGQCTSQYNQQVYETYTGWFAIPLSAAPGWQQENGDRFLRLDNGIITIINKMAAKK